jgi:tetratricopeptide (TPR) repeat protein
MTKKMQTPETDIMVESKGKVESFFDKYGNKLMWALVAVTIIVVGVFVWNNQSEKAAVEAEQKAQAALFGVMVEYSAADVDNVAAAEAYAAVNNKYQDAVAGNIAAYMAASSYLQANELDKAKAAIAKYENTDGDFGKMINALALTMKGDIAVEEMDYKTAAANFAKALKASTTESLYMKNAKKLALVYEAMGDEANAQQVYENAVKKYPENKSFEKYIK